MSLLTPLWFLSLLAATFAQYGLLGYGGYGLGGDLNTYGSGYYNPYTLYNGYPLNPMSYGGLAYGYPGYGMGSGFNGWGNNGMSGSFGLGGLSGFGGSGIGSGWGITNYGNTRGGFRRLPGSGSGLGGRGLHSGGSRGGSFDGYPWETKKN